MSEVKIGPLVLEYDEDTRYLGVGNGEELLGTAEIDPETWEALRAAVPSDTPGAMEALAPGVDHVQRAGEARESLAGALGHHRLKDDYLPTPTSLEDRTRQLEERHKFIELGMARALDRIDRLLQGEDYIEKWRKASEESKGGIHFEAPAAEALPN